MLSVCPFCESNVLLAELERHANNHFLEDDYEKDMQLAKHISLGLPITRFMDAPVYLEESSSDSPEKTAPITESTNNPKYLTETHLQERIASLMDLQTKSTFNKVDGGLLPLLRRCLELENRKFRSVISGHIDHYQSTEFEDYGWGCGWRNIQMLSSHLLIQKEEARDVLFGGSKFVPDIPSLQRWLEVAWDRGFDLPGSQFFNKHVYGTKKWIGTTECATLFRSFGLRARIVDFDSLPSSKRQFFGPMDKFLQPCQSGEQNGVSNYDRYDKGWNQSGHQVLMKWVWNYFTHETDCWLDVCQNVFVSAKTPLYFQHDGHSRTIVGIQMQTYGDGSQERYSLLILDPGQRTRDLEKSLRDNNGWQRLIKRGVHTLKKPQYQLCYIDPGISSKEELEDLKTIQSKYIRL